MSPLSNSKISLFDFWRGGDRGDHCDDTEGGGPAGGGSAGSSAVGVLGLVRTHYLDFGPTLACEKLAAHHWHKLSAETLCQWIIADGLWKPRARRSARIHQRRAPPRAARSTKTRLDLQPACSAQALEEPHLPVQYKNREYQLTGQGKGYRLRGAQVTVCEAFDGSVTLLSTRVVLPHPRRKRTAHPLGR